MKTLVIFNKNWADECDVHGLALMNDHQVSLLQKAIPELSYGFGSNQGWEKGDFERSDFRFRLLSDGEAYVLQMTLPFYDSEGYPSWGNFPNMDDYFFDEEGNKL